MLYIMEAIYAIDSSNGLAKNGIIPWKSKKDMSFFVNKTKNNIVIMGKNTYFSLPVEHRPLKNRLNIVITSTPELYQNTINDVIFTNNTNIYEDILQNKSKYVEAHNYLNPDFTIFIIGGKTIYEKFIPLCEKIWITKFKHNYNCDLFMNYEYSTQYHVETVEEDEELTITVGGCRTHGVRKGALPPTPYDPFPWRAKRAI